MLSESQICYGFRMWLLLPIALYLSQALASDPLDHKKGLVLGIGGNISSYEFPVQFVGETKNRIDKTSSLYGPTLGLGYDFMPGNSFLLGLRGEGFYSDTFGTGTTDNAKVEDRTTGKIIGGNASLRAGWVFDFWTKDLVGDKVFLIGELFAEGGITSGHKSFSKSFTFHNAGVNEIYKDNVEEEYQGKVFSAGINLTTPGGAFLEVKFVTVNVTSNKQTFTGSYQTNGGTLTPTSQKLENKNMQTMATYLIMVGHHY
jgi:hypothetical protein